MPGTAPRWPAQNPAGSRDGYEAPIRGRISAASLAGDGRTSGLSRFPSACACLDCLLRFLGGDRVPCAAYRLGRGGRPRGACGVDGSIVSVSGRRPMPELSAPPDVALAQAALFVAGAAIVLHALVSQAAPGRPSGRVPDLLVRACGDPPAADVDGGQHTLSDQRVDDRLFEFIERLGREPRLLRKSVTAVIMSDLRMRLSNTAVVADPPIDCVYNTTKSYISEFSGQLGKMVRVNNRCARGAPTARFPRSGLVRVPLPRE